MPSPPWRRALVCVSHRTLIRDWVKPPELATKIRILASTNKRRTAPHFEAVAQASVKRLQLRIVYFTRSRNDRGERVVSPQRLIHYKENWYLIAWCHKAEGLRMFALDAIEDARQTNEAAIQVTSKQVDDLLGRDFGIYSGQERQWAKLKFTPVQARWVEAEVWHPEQKSTALEDGSYLLEIPYSDPRELMLEILRFGADVQVLEPLELRNAVKERLQKAAAQYD